mmetsp:Transcript_25791/g.51707  ORF Transcript_25791/g.51707 Transcript_25791/m.51707 type:complete len:289 (+) Transcript_25791:85-951(+)|eukprot:CAMPEP_0170394884 /NCGR_PEP_ID=MMETSP0117_2-20130122/21489_1 /TAXON_ID=400756 /ORGANISM="Durinskia baltica, Strain CSIRO CS-38" /LENGTH=288 /DNA_ID=CAMNT_0010651169 /DNA_START=79 /DNA_END=945 /DNA_ORIENTATION=-
MSILCSTFQDVRERAAKFCSERDWQKFHLPPSITLALSGECGELCEIFQWKGSLERNPNGEHWSPREIEHIGEEMADVFIYTTRLSDICNIDLAHAVKYNTQTNCGKRHNNEKWTDLKLDGLASQANHRSQRHVCFDLVSEVGKLTALFSMHSEEDSGVGLTSWDSVGISSLARHMGRICLLLASLSRFGGHSLAKCVDDKLKKNALKYPADKARGSSAKYTAYTRMLSTGYWQKVTSWCCWGVGVGVFILYTDMIFGLGLKTGFAITTGKGMHQDIVGGSIVGKLIM